jgi:hypothetical protein
MNDTPTRRESFSRVEKVAEWLSLTILHAEGMAANSQGSR